MKKVLIINESSLIRDFLQQKLGALGMEVAIAMNGFDGQLKMRTQDPDLVIMDYFLSRVSSSEILIDKMKNPNVKATPVIMLANKLSKERLMEIAKLGVKKFFAKPIKMDSLIKSISDLLSIDLKIDTTPCIIDAHFNDGIIFIEVARGLNTEKIDLLKLKIDEILKLYEASIPKVLIIMTDVQLEEGDTAKLHDFLTAVRDTTRTPLKGTKILTQSDSVKKLLKRSTEFNKLEVTDNINDAMDKLLGIKVSDFIDEGLKAVREDFFKAEKTDKQTEETIQLRFSDENSVMHEAPASAVPTEEEKVKIAIVDDDPVIRELLSATYTNTSYRVLPYENGKLFVEDVDNNTPDLVFLDLLMPEMDGFTVLKKLKERQFESPIIILSALTQKETVVKALRLGVKSYLSKPLKPIDIMKKTQEVLNLGV